MTTDNIIEFEIADKRKFEKTSFLDFEFGAHIVRILDKPVVIYTHYIQNKGSFRCLGEECPVCKNNDAIRREHGKDAYKMPGFVSPQRRHYVNVLDRTPVKVCPGCGYEVKKNLMYQYSPQCPKCNAFVTEVPETISDKVKMANISESNADQLMEYQKSFLDANKEPIGLRGFDVVFMVTKVPQSNGKDKKAIAVVPTNPLDTTPISMAELEEFKYDPFNSVINLTADEIVSLLGGVSMKDIFAGRRATQPEAVATSTAEIEGKINEIFADNPPF